MEAKNLVTQMEKRTELNRLIDRLLAEPYSVSQKIEDASLESIQRSFEEIDEAFADGSPPDEIVDVQESYERAKELFCLVLLELEALGARGGETLHEIRHHEAGTQLIAPRVESSRPPAPPAPPSNLSIVPPKRNETPPPAPASSIKPSDDDLFASLEGEEIHWSTDLSPADAPDFKAPKSTPAPAPAAELPADSDIDAPASIGDEGIMPFPFEKEEAEAARTVPTPQPPPAPPSVETVLAAPVPELPPIEPPSPVIELPEAPPPAAGPTDPKAAEYLEWADRFREKPEWSGDGRFEAQCLLFAVECELWARLRPAVQAFWPKKDGAIRELLDTGNKRFDFHPMLKKGLDALIEEHGAWLADGQLPLASVLNSVRYLTSAPDWNTFWPLPVELGMLLLFFGGERAMRGLILRNHLGVMGLGPEESVEAAFRLFRCQKARNRALSPSGEGPDLKTLREDAERLLELAARIEAETDRG